MELVVAMTYGRALFDAATEVDKVDEIGEEIAALDVIFSKEKDYYGLLNNPAISNIKKKTLIRKVFEGRICKEALSLLYILIDKNRLLYFHAILAEFNKLVDESRGLGKGIIYSVIPLSEDQLSDFEEQAGKLLNEKIKLKNEIDKNLIGGVKLLVDDKLIDASLRSDLEKLTERIKQVKGKEERP